MRDSLEIPETAVPAGSLRCATCDAVTAEAAAGQQLNDRWICGDCLSRLRRPPVLFQRTLLNLFPLIGNLGWLYLFGGSAFAFIAYFVKGYEYIDAYVSPFFEWTAGLALVLLLPASLLLLTSRRTRPWGGLGLLAYSFILGQSIWVGCLTVAGFYWGGVGIIVGTMCMGLGVIAEAVLASIFHGYFIYPTIIVLLCGVVLACRYGGLALCVSALKDVEI